MYIEQFAYSLVVSQIEQEDARKLLKVMAKEDFFAGALSSVYTQEDIKHKQVFFDCGQRGCINKIERETVEQNMHRLAQEFPGAKFYLTAENLDNTMEQYEICTYGDMYQFAELQNLMPELSKPVPFDQREEGKISFHEEYIQRQDVLSQFLHNTDFNLLYRQKLALVNAQEKNVPVPAEVLEGLINFLDHVGDWAERSGVFVYPEMDPKPFLNELISSAESQTCPPSSAPGKETSKEIG